MAAVKAYFYRLRKDMPDVCEGVDIPRFLEGLRHEFGRVALESLNPKTKIPGGPVYYSDTPRKCHERSRVYRIEDAISDCLRYYDKRGQAKKTLSKMIAVKAVNNPEFRERLIAYERVPQSWQEERGPLDPEARLDKKVIANALRELQDRDFSHANNARGRRHPLARIMESRHFTETEKLRFIANYMVGNEKKKEAPWAVRLGNRHDYTELNSARFLEENGAFILETVGDIVLLKEHFTATNKLKKGSMPGLKQLEPGDLKLEP